MTEVLGLLGGTFDPVHNGHVAIARHLCGTLDLHGVRFILNRQPPHRIPPVCPAGHRFAMLEAALAEYPNLVPDSRELERAGPSYSLWTLRSLRRTFPDDSLCWIIGADAYLGLKSWFRWQELSSLAHFLVVKRPGWDLEDASGRLSTDIGVLRRRLAGASVLCEAPEIDLSASGLRDRIAAGGDASDSLPAPVWRYIQVNQLYGYLSTHS